MGLLGEGWNGTKWANVHALDPAAGDLAGLDSVSCTSASHRVAVGGESATATGAVHPLVEVWNGSTWTQQTAPN